MAYKEFSELKIEKDFSSPVNWRGGETADTAT